MTVNDIAKDHILIFLTRSFSGTGGVRACLTIIITAFSLYVSVYPPLIVQSIPFRVLRNGRQIRRMSNIPNRPKGVEECVGRWCV